MFYFFPEKATYYFLPLQRQSPEPALHMLLWNNPAQFLLCQFWVRHKILHMDVWITCIKQPLLCLSRVPQDEQWQENIWGWDTFFLLMIICFKFWYTRRLQDDKTWDGLKTLKLSQCNGDDMNCKGWQTHQEGRLNSVLQSAPTWHNRWDFPARLSPFHTFQLHNLMAIHLFPSPITERLVKNLSPMRDPAQL